MGRPKNHLSSAEIEAQIARVQRERDDEVKRLDAKRRDAQAVENRRRGELLTGYLAGPRGDDLRRILDTLATPKDRALFGLDGARPAAPHAPDSPAPNRDERTKAAPPLAERLPFARRSQ